MNITSCVGGFGGSSQASANSQKLTKVTHGNVQPSVHYVCTKRKREQSGA